MTGLALIEMEPAVIAGGRSERHRLTVVRPTLPPDVDRDRRKARIPDRRANLYCRGECGCQGGGRVESCDGRGKARCDRCSGTRMRQVPG